MDAAAQGADFDDLLAVMAIPLKRVPYDTDRRTTARRLLRELQEDGLVVHEGDKYRLAEIEDDELRQAIAYLPFAYSE